MSHRDDYSDDMLLLRTFDDRSVEALLAGRLPADREDLADLAQALASVRDAATQEPRPNPSPALAAVLARGLEGADAERLAGDARRLAPQPRTSGWTRRKRMVLEALAAVAAKLAALGLPAKAALAATTTAGLVVAGGAAGVLPEQVNASVRGGITQVTGLEFPEAAEPGLATAEAAPHGAGAADVGVQAHGEDHGLPPATELPGDAHDGWEFGLGVAQHNTQDTPAQVPDDVPAGEGAAEQFRPQETPGSAATADEHRPEETPAGGPGTTGDTAPAEPPAGPPEGTPGPGATGQQRADDHRPETPGPP